MRSISFCLGQFLSSFAFECIYWDERQAKKYDEFYARDIPNLDGKVNFPISELDQVKKMLADLVTANDDVCTRAGTSW